MKIFFLGLFVFLAAMSVAAWEIRPALAPPGKVPLIWVSDNNPMRQGQIQLFEQLYPNDDLRLDPDNGGMEKVIVQSLAGVGPDLFDCYDGFQLSAYVRSGIAWDVTDELKKMGIDVQKEVWPAVLSDCVLDGRVYGTPPNVAANAVWFNKSLFRKAHIPYPHGHWTWQNMVPLAQKLTIRDANGRPLQFGLLFDWSNNWLQFVYQWGGRLYSPGGTRCIIDSPQAVAGVQFMHDLIYKYRVTPSPVEEAEMATQGGWGSGTITLFGGGRGALALGGRWWLNTLRDKKNYPDLSLGAVPCPAGRYYIYRGYGKATLINRNSPRRREALQFLAYLLSPQYARLINHQADGMAPIIQAAYTPAFLHDPAYPEEDYNEVWRDALEHSIPDQISPFVNGNEAERILNQQMDLIKGDQKPVAEALKTAADEINAEIQKTIQLDPTLRRRYIRLTRGAHS